MNRNGVSGSGGAPGARCVETLMRAGGAPKRRSMQRLEAVFAEDGLSLAAVQYEVFESGGRGAGLYGLCDGVDDRGVCVGGELRNDPYAFFCQGIGLVHDAQ